MENLPAKQNQQSQALQRSWKAEELTSTTIFHQLTIADKEVALACIQQPIKNLTPQQISVKMLGLIGKTFLNTGGNFKEKKEDVNATLDELCDDLQKYNGLLSFSEIEIAFKNGWKKEYGEFYGLNNSTYFLWVNAYTLGESRLRVKKMLSNAKENANMNQPIKSPEEVEYILKAAVLKCFDEFRQGGVIFDAGNVKYNYLDKKGLIKFTKERKDAILTTIKERLRLECLNNKSRSETVEKALKKVLNASVLSECKKEALRQYFSELIEMEIELSDLLN